MRVFLADRLSSRHNALNVIRLALATTVMIGHFDLGAHYPSIHVGLGPAHWAVNGFFAISGYLICASRARTNATGFLWRRFLRIYPGYWTVLLVTALVFAPLLKVMAGKPYVPSSAWGYVWRNSSLLYLQEGIGTVPYWNISLWTLQYEFACYLVVLMISRAFLVRRRGTGAAAVALVGLGCAAVAAVTQDGQGLVHSSARLFGFFAAGILVFFVADRIRVTPRVALVAAGIAGVLIQVGLGMWAMVPTAVALLTMGAAAPGAVGSRP